MKAALQSAPSALPLAAPCARFALLPVTLPQLAPAQRADGTGPADRQGGGRAGGRAGATGAATDAERRQSTGSLSSALAGAAAGGASRAGGGRAPAKQSSRPWAAWLGGGTL